MEFLEDEEADEMMNEIVRRRDIARRTNWRCRSTALSQRDVAVAATIHSSISFYVTLLYLVLYQMNSIQQIILHNNNRRSNFFRRLQRALKYYKCLFQFCSYKIDVLVDEETDLLFLRRYQLFPLVHSPPRNRSIDEISEEKAKELTRFTKEQLRLLLLHWRMPDVIVTGPRYQFTGEEVLLICLSKIATGDPWTRLIDGFFGGDPRRWSYAFRWFINHLFVLFYHKISGRSMEIWLPEINNLNR
jgi:hypothetical protein